MVFSTIMKNSKTEHNKEAQPGTFIPYTPMIEYILRDDAS